MEGLTGDGDGGYDDSERVQCPSHDETNPLPVLIDAEAVKHQRCDNESRGNVGGPEPHFWLKGSA